MANQTVELRPKLPAVSTRTAISVRQCGTVTQKDLARLAGVSPSTIYNFLHSKKSVLPETRDRIDRIIKEYDYQTNGIARAMVKGKTEVLGILVPRIDVRFYSEIVAAIEQHMNSNNYNCLICQHLDDMLKEEREIRMMRERCVDGIIIRASGRREHDNLYRQLDRIGMPFVLVDRIIPGLEEHFVGPDNFACGYEITKYLIEKGHNRIGVLVWPEASGKLGAKYEGYRKAIEDHGIELDEKLVQVCSNEYFAGREETLAMMRRVGTNKPTALLGLNDTILIGGIGALMELGMTIPDDIAVANIGGFMDNSLGALSRLRITCLSQPCETIGREAARMLASQIEGGNWRRGPVFCPAQIRVGNTA